MWNKQSMKKTVENCTKLVLYWQKMHSSIHNFHFGESLSRARNNNRPRPINAPSNNGPPLEPLRKNNRPGRLLEVLR